MVEGNLVELKGWKSVVGVVDLSVDVLLLLKTLFIRILLSALSLCVTS